MHKVSMFVAVLPNASLCVLTTNLTNILYLLFFSFMFAACSMMLFVFPPWLLLNPDSPNKVRNPFYLHYSTDCCTDNWTTCSTSPKSNTIKAQTRNMYRFQTLSIWVYHLTLLSTHNTVYTMWLMWCWWTQQIRCDSEAQHMMLYVISDWTVSQWGDNQGGL